MPKRNIRLYIEDILDSVRAIQSFTADLSFEQFAGDRKTCSATIREYIVIGEAVAALKEPLENLFPDYRWRMIKDFRNFIVHEYFGVDARIIWDLTTQELPELESMVRQLQKQLADTP
jgi:uncharacterized protein with HEPN domain